MSTPYNSLAWYKHLSNCIKNANKQMTSFRKIFNRKLIWRHQRFAKVSNHFLYIQLHLGIVDARVFCLLLYTNHPNQLINVVQFYSQIPFRCPIAVYRAYQNMKKSLLLQGYQLTLVLFGYHGEEYVKLVNEISLK